MKLYCGYLCFRSVFLPLSTKLESFTELLWIVAINDFMLKYVAVISKIFVVLLPPIALPYRKRVRILIL